MTMVMSLKKILLFAFLIDCLLFPQIYSLAHAFAEEDLTKLLNTRDCAGCDLTDADLSKLNLDRANLGEANLSGANLQGTSLKLADLAGADLTNANLEGADFVGADLYKAALNGANTKNTSFDGAYLVGTILESAAPGEVAASPEKPSSPPDIAPKTGEKDEEIGSAVKETGQLTAPPAAGLAIKSDEAIVLDEQKGEQAKQGKVAKDATLAKDTDSTPPTGYADAPTQQQASAPSFPDTGEQPLTPRHQQEAEPVAIAAQEKTREEKQTVQQDKPAATPDIIGQKPLRQDNAQESMPDTLDQKTDQNELAQPTPDTPDTVEQTLAKNLERLRKTNRCVECNLAGADLAKEDLEEAHLERANLSGANLRKADLEKANLKAANLSGANLTDADLEEADLYKANLTGADLTDANLEDASLDGADLTNAILEGANLEGVIK